ncbi:MAG: hypothetical protein ACRETB_11540 [Steroidobacteraceae bacterium]
MKTDHAEADAWVERHLSGWPASRRRLAVGLITEYGRPQDAAPHAITWYGNAPWKRTTLYRAGVRHNFPLPHEDVLEQTIDYRVPFAKAADLIRYDGSLVVDRTRGELSAHCDTEQQNRIMLNIANDIVTGQSGVDEAVAYHAQIIRALQDHLPESYPLKLQFKILPSSVTADPGTVAQLLQHLGE